MDKEIKNAIFVGIILFIICDIPLFILSMYFNNNLIILNFNFFSITPYIYLVIPLMGALLFFLVGKILDWIRHKDFSFHFPETPPLLQIDGFNLKGPHGINWRIIVGSDIHGRTYYVDSCRCPKCDCELSDESKSKIFGWIEKKFWKCPNCNFEIEKPKKSYFEIKSDIKKVAENIYEKEKNNY